jgi:hypothetical protein
MRRSCALLVGVAILSGGCSAVPTVMGISGSDWVPLKTREQVHNAFGTPLRTATLDGIPFEEFRVRSGCDQNVLGSRVPAFQPLEEFHIRGWSDLQIVAVKDVGSITPRGNNLIVVAGINNVLHFRIFDEVGNTVVDTDETKLPTKSRTIVDLKGYLENLWPPQTLKAEEKNRVIMAVVSIVGHNPLGSFELGVGSMESYGLVHIGTLPTERDPRRIRVLPGQTIRFDYDESGKVAKVYLDGEFISSLTKNPSTDPLDTSANPQR